MKKVFYYYYFFISLIFLINWSKQTSIPKTCSGTIYYINNNENEKSENHKEDTEKGVLIEERKLSQEEIVDVKIGTSKEVCDNQNIVVYREPKHANKNPKNSIEYMFDLDKVNEITVNKNAIYRFDHEDYIRLMIKYTNGSSANYIIPKTQKIIGKVKKTGTIALYPFDEIYKLVIHNCKIKEEEK